MPASLALTLPFAQIIMVLDEQAKGGTMAAALCQELEARVAGLRRILECPISLDILEDPVLLFPSGCTYSRKYIKQHWELGSRWYVLGELMQVLAMGSTKHITWVAGVR